jgi:hypothetical protein
MSVQIEVAQSVKDEQELIAFLLQRERLLALPRNFPSHEFDPRPLGEHVAGLQIIFREQDVGLVRECVAKVPEGPLYPGDKNLYSGSVVAAHHGASIEWHRSEHPGPSQYTRGRLYFKHETPKSPETTAALNRLFTAIVRYIKKNSPKRSAEKYPFYVGRDLAEMVERGEAQVVYGQKGTAVELVTNEKFGK